MGFQAKSYRLKWPEGHELHGLEMSCRGMPIGALDKVGTMDGGTPAEQAARFPELLALFADALKTWNYEDDGVPVATDYESLQAVDMRALMPIVMTWIREVTNIPDPLPEPSTSGRPFQVELPPMDLPSPNLTNSAIPA